MDFQTFHDYNRLVRRELVQPLRCDICDEIPVLRVDSNDEPYLHCFFCGAKAKPGLATYEYVQAVVKEHFK